MRYCFALLLTLFLVSDCFGAGVYKWIDENNNVVYSQTPPPYGTKALSTPYISSASSDSGETANSRADAMNNVFKSDEEKEEDRIRDDYDKRLKEYCDSLVKDLEIYAVKGRVYQTNEDGERVYLDEEARLTAMEETKQKQKEHCGK